METQFMKTVWEFFDKEKFKKRLTNIDNIYICYSPEFHYEKIPRITVVAVYKNNVLKFGVARCSVKDRFVRKIGRNLALKRILDDDAIMTIKIKKVNSKIFHDLANNIIDYIWNSDVSDWNNLDKKNKK